MKKMTEHTPRGFAPLMAGTALERVARAIAEHFGQTLDMVRSRGKQAELSTPRFIIYYVLHKHHGLSSKYVGRLLHRDHGAVLNGCKQFSNWLDTTKSANTLLTMCLQVVDQVSEQDGFTVGINVQQTKQQSVNRVKGTKGKKKSKRSVKAEKSPELLTAYSPNTENSPSLYKYIYKNSKGVTKGEAVEYTLPPRLDNPDFYGVWNEWLNHRGDIKKPLTQNMVKAQLKMMSREGTAVSIETMQSSMEQGWTGLFPEKITGRKNARIKNNKNINAGFNKGDGTAYEAKARSTGAEEVGEAFSL